MKNTEISIEKVKIMTRSLARRFDEELNPEFSAREVEDWKRVGEAHIAAIKAEAESSWMIRNKKIIAMSWWAFLPTAFIALMFQNSGTSGHSNNVLDLFENTICSLIAVVLFAFVVNQVAEWARLFDARRNLSALTSASKNPMQCKEALQQVEQWTEVKAYRDSLLESGRELVALDLSIMGHLSRQAAAAYRASSDETACKKLHGLTVDDRPAGAKVADFAGV